jgi:hypothetical protein
MEPMNVTAISEYVAEFIKSHKTEFEELSRRETQLLELGALVLTAEHYKQRGYDVTACNLVHDRFRVKCGAKGNPWNFSWFECTRDETVLEVHANLQVESAYQLDNGVYAIDVGVTQAGWMPDKKGRKNWRSVNNDSLITFVEVKKLVVYPMLLAQFVGIVHEIKPSFLTGSVSTDFVNCGHFPPALISLGYLHGNCHGIRDGFIRRDFRLTIVPAFDRRIARLRSGDDDQSPFDDIQPRKPMTDEPGELDSRAIDIADLDDLFT